MIPTGVFHSPSERLAWRAYLAQRRDALGKVISGRTVELSNRPFFRRLKHACAQWVRPAYISAGVTSVAVLAFVVLLHRRKIMRRTRSSLDKLANSLVRTKKTFNLFDKYKRCCFKQLQCSLYGL